MENTFWSKNILTIHYQAFNLVIEKNENIICDGVAWQFLIKTIKQPISLILQD